MPEKSPHCPWCVSRVPGNSGKGWTRLQFSHLTADNRGLIHWYSCNVCKRRYTRIHFQEIVEVYVADVPMIG